MSVSKGRNLHLTKEERLVVNEGELGLEKEANSRVLTLVGSLFTPRSFNAQALRNIMKSAWRTKRGFMFRELAGNKFTFQFADGTDKEKVMRGGPWCFDKSILILIEASGEQLSGMKFDKASL